MNINLADISDLKEVAPGWLLGTLYIMDTPHHLTLLEVIDDEGTQRAPDEAGSTVDTMLDDLMNFDGVSEPYMTILYNDKEWVCAITPYCR